MTARKKRASAPSPDPMRIAHKSTSAELDEESIVGPSKPHTIDAAMALWDRACEPQYKGLLDARAWTEEDEQAYQARKAITKAKRAAKRKGGPISEPLCAA